MTPEQLSRIEDIAGATPFYEEAAALLHDGFEMRMMYPSNFDADDSAEEKFGQFSTSLQNAMLISSAVRLCRRNERYRRRPMGRTPVDWFLRNSRSTPDEVLAKLIRMGLIYAEGQKSAYDALMFSPVGLPPILEAIEERNNIAAFPPDLHAALADLRSRVASGKAQRDIRLVGRLERMLEYGSLEAPFGIRGKFASSLSDWVQSLVGTRRSVWTKLVKLAVRLECGENRQLFKEITDAAEMVQQLEPTIFVTDITKILEFAQARPPYAYDYSLSIFDELLSLFDVDGFAADWSPFAGKGELLAEPFGSLYASWSVPEVAEQRDKWTSGEKNRFAKQRREMQWTIRPVLMGMTEGPKAITVLLRIRDATESEYGRNEIDQKLGELAFKHGKSIKALIDDEDAALPDFDLDQSGSLSVDIGRAKALLSVTAAGVEISWLNQSGKAVKSAPAPVRRDHAPEYAAFKQQAKELRQEYRKQIASLQLGWINGSSWPLQIWKEHYLKHPLRKPAVEALIWRIEHDDMQVSVLPTSGRLLDISGNAVSLPSDARVRLWHPLDEEPEEVLAWRDRIIDLGITQPIKQAHREIYVLTEAERKTAVYSNRFAAHILRKHQLNGLRKASGWNTDSYNDFEDPQRRLPELGLRVEFQMEWIENEHVATDQIRFLRPGYASEAINLDQVPPIVFSEIMRDCDLFVAVASVANDPTWSDGGPEGRHRGYWHDWAFGDLGQSAKVRRDLIARFAGSLSIADKLEIGEKALIVEGKRQKYAIHFGSTNVQVLPENRYLCIVPDRSAPEAERVRLPFTGDNHVSTILAKAFLLADEDRITDGTILSQL